MTVAEVLFRSVTVKLVPLIAAIIPVARNPFPKAGTLPACVVGQAAAVPLAGLPLLAAAAACVGAVVGAVVGGGTGVVVAEELPPHAVRRNVVSAAIPTALRSSRIVGASVSRCAAISTATKPSWHDDRAM